MASSPQQNKLNIEGFVWLVSLIAIIAWMVGTNGIADVIFRQYGYLFFPVQLLSIWLLLRSRPNPFFWLGVEGAFILSTVAVLQWAWLGFFTNT